MIAPAAASASHDVLLRRGVRLECATLAWNALGCVVLLAHQCFNAQAVVDSQTQVISITTVCEMASEA